MHRQQPFPIKTWRLSDFFFPGATPRPSAITNTNNSHGYSQRSEYALVILNQPLPPTATLLTLWNLAKYRICADGGANRLYDSLARDQQRADLKPSVICGDLDSLRKDVWSYYQKQGVEIQKVECQDTTDLQKCMDWILSKQHETQDSDLDIVVVGALTGRFDQAISSLQFLHLNPDRSIYLVSDGNAAMYLSPGYRHVIQVRRGFEGPMCGLLPIGGKVVCRTSGLRWNLGELGLGEGVNSNGTSNDTVGQRASQWGTLQFGGLVSTSNEVRLEDDNALLDEVVVEVPAKLDKEEGNVGPIWTCELHVSVVPADVLAG